MMVHCIFTGGGPVDGGHKAFEFDANGTPWVVVPTFEGREHLYGGDVDLLPWSNTATLRYVGVVRTLQELPDADI